MSNDNNIQDDQLQQPNDPAKQEEKASTEAENSPSKVEEAKGSKSESTESAESTESTESTESQSPITIPEHNPRFLKSKKIKKKWLFPTETFPVFNLFFINL